MNYIVRSKNALPKPRAWTVNRDLEGATKPEPLNIVTRRYEISWLDDDGLMETKTAVAPALPIFQDAFSAFAQGCLIQTPGGHTAIEDLVPGDLVSTADGGSQPLLWIGSMTLYPNGSDLGLPSAELFRVTEGSYGLERTAPDLMLGPAARILPGLFAIDSSSELLNVTELDDGFSVIKIQPVSPIRVFHLCLGDHRLIRANGVLVESFHPGANTQMHMSQELFDLYLSLFPHIGSESEFGPMNHPRSH